MAYSIVFLQPNHSATHHASYYFRICVPSCCTCACACAHCMRTAYACILGIGVGLIQTINLIHVLVQVL